jgi:short-subunit dehydrogenase
VTGGSSGIGAALVEQLAEQGLNVLVIAYPDQLLKDFEKKMQTKFPKREFRFVGADLTDDNPENGYMTIIKKETANLDIGVVFSNAGFIRIGVWLHILDN